MVIVQSLPLTGKTTFANKYDSVIDSESEFLSHYFQPGIRESLGIHLLDKLLRQSFINWYIDNHNLWHNASKIVLTNLTLTETLLPNLHRNDRYIVVMPHDILLNGGVSYHKRFKTLSETTRKDIKSAATAEDVDKWLEQYRRFAAVSKYYRNPKCEIVQIRETEYLTDVLTYLTHFSLY